MKKKMKTRVVKDMSKYVENFMAGMSFRQTTLCIIGVAIVIVTYTVLKVPDILAIALGFPVIMAAFYKPDGLKLEQYLWYWIESKFLNKTVRYYERENVVYDFFWRGMINGKKIKRRIAEDEKGSHSKRKGVSISKIRSKKYSN